MELKCMFLNDDLMSRDKLVCSLNEENDVTTLCQQLKSMR